MAAAVSSDPKLNVTDAIRRSWWSFLLLGLLLTVAGIMAIALPVVSTLATSVTVGVLLAACGLVQAFQAFGARTWTGFLWHLALGIVELVGGIAIYMQPYLGAIALTLVIAIVLLAQGATQSALAWRVRPRDGWGWLLLAGLVTLLAGVVLAVKLPIAGLYTPGIMVGISLLFSGTAYLAIALAGRSIVRALSVP